MSDSRNEGSLRSVLAAAAVALALGGAQPLDAQDWRTISQSRPLAGERALDVDVEYAAGEIRLGPAASGSLYRMTMRYDEVVFSPSARYADGRLKIGVNDGNIRGGRDMKGGLLDLKLSTAVPLDLDVKFGAAEAAIELGGMHVRRADISTGASSTQLTVSAPNPIVCDRLQLEVGAAKFRASQLGNLNARRMTLQGGVGEVILDFSGGWQRDLTGTIEMGLGTLTLHLPRGLGVRIRKGGLLSSFDSQGLVKRGDEYFSEDWDSAAHKLSLDITAALGSINVVWVDSQ